MESPAPTQPVTSKPAMPPMCYACGQMLQGNETKCPSCGAPLHRTVRGERRSGRLTVAAALFFGLALTTLTVAGFYLFDADGLGDSSANLGGITFAVTGTVHYANGTGAPWVVVRVDEHTNGTTTDANGTYTLHGVPVGIHTVTFSTPNASRVDAKIFVTKDEVVDASLAPGNGTVVVHDNSYATWVRLVNVCGGLLGAVALLLLAGAVACFRRRTYALALVAAWFSLVEIVAFLPAVLVSIVVIVLVIRSKGEFR